MQVTKYTYVDIYYNPNEQDKADKEKKRLEKLGYNLEVKDDGSGKYLFCDQYLKYSKGCKDNI